MAKRSKQDRRAKRQAKKALQAVAKKTLKGRGARPDVWGIWDTQAGGWMGDSKGPKLFRDEPSPGNGVMMDGEMLAKFAAEMVGMQVGDILRYCCRAYNEKEVHKVEDVKVRFDSLTALKRIEQGLLG